MDGLIAYALAKKYADQVGQSILDAGFKVRVEQDRSILNQTGEQMILYFVPKESSLSTDTYDEYIYTTKWEFVGSTDVNIDYTQLKNKPSINNIELNGNKTPTELDIDDYTKLRNYPQIAYSDGYNFYNTKFMGKLTTAVNGEVRISKSGTNSNPVFTIILDNRAVFTVKTATNYDLNNYTVHAPFFYTSAANRFSHLPDFVVPQNNSTVGLVNISGKNSDTQMQLLFWIDSNNDSHYALRVLDSPWREIKDGSRIVSGVVNQNGTITFTDSGGNTFTTTGSSVIGPQGDDYVLTNQDKTDIANVVLQLLPNADTMLFPEVSEVNNE